MSPHSQQIERKSFPVELVSQTTLEDFLRRPHGPIDVISTSYIEKGIEVVCKIDFQSKFFFRFRLTSEIEADHAAAHISKYIAQYGYSNRIKGFGVRFGNSQNSIDKILNDAKNWWVLPDKSPELWPGLRYTSEPLPDFFRRVWAGYLNHGLSLEKLRKLDPSLRHAIKNHLKKKLYWPEDLQLPNMRKDLDKVESLFDEFGQAQLSEKEIIAVMRRRVRRNDKNSEKQPCP